MLDVNCCPCNLCMGGREGAGVSTPEPGKSGGMHGSGDGDSTPHTCFTHPPVRKSLLHIKSFTPRPIFPHSPERCTWNTQHLLLLSQSHLQYYGRRLKSLIGPAPTTHPHTLLSLLHPPTTILSSPISHPTPTY